MIYNGNVLSHIKKFKVIKVNNKFPVKYLLKDYQGNLIAGRFYDRTSKDKLF